MGPSPPERQYDIGALQGGFQRSRNPLPVIAHGGFLVDVNPVFRQHATHVGRVRVDDLPEEQFGANHDNFCVHTHSPVDYGVCWRIAVARVRL